MTHFGDSLDGKAKSYLTSLDEFSFEQVVGHGGFACVYCGHHKEKGIRCAIKKLNVERLKPQDQEYFLREIRILSNINNCFCLEFLGWTNTPPYSIITRYVPNGDLYHNIHGPNKHDSVILKNPTKKTLIALGLANALKYLHKNNIIHRDVKSLNILLDENYYPVLCDFGLSKMINITESGMLMTKNIGTPNWMAPEICGSGNYSSKVDVFSFGFILYELLTGKIPFEGAEEHKITQRIRDGERPPFEVEDPITHLIEKCWATNPKKRPDMKQVYKRLKKGEYYFKGTNRQEVEDFLIALNEKKKNVEKSPLFASSTSRTAPRNDHQVEDFSYNDFLNEPLLSNYSHPYYLTNFYKAMEYVRVNPSYARYYFEKISPIFLMLVESPSFVPILSAVMISICDLIEYSDQIFQTFLDLKMLTMLSNTRPLNAIYLRIALVTVKRKPSILNEEDCDLLKQLASCASDYPYNVLVIINTCICNIDQITKNNHNLFHFLSSNQCHFIHSCDTLFIKIVLFLYKKFQSFNSPYLEDVKSVITDLLKESNSNEAIVTTYDRIGALQISHKVPIEIILKHLSNKSTRSSCLAYMIQNILKYVNDDVHSVIQVLLENSRYPPALRCLFDLISKSKHARSSICKLENEWCILNSIDKLTVVMILCSMPDSLDKICRSYSVCEFVTSLYDTNNNFCADLSMIATHLVIKLVGGNNSIFLMNAIKTRLFDILLDNMNGAYKSLYEKHLYCISDKVLRCSYNEVFNKLIPIILSNISSENELTIHSYILAALLSNNKSAVPCLNETDILVKAKCLEGTKHESIYRCICDNLSA